ncbi:MAG TPA: nucleotide exchange factor GrpE [Opitutaceae bacterium]
MTFPVTDMTDASSNKNSNSTAGTPAEEQDTAVDTAASGESSSTEQIAPADTSSELEKLRTERDDFYNRYLRSVADLDNYRRRVQREKDELRQYAVSDVVEQLLPIIENLGLAVASAKQAADPQTIVTGVSMVLEQFRATLSGVGLSEINPAPGADFDPHQHESLAHAPSEEIAPEKVLQVARVGYSLKGRLLRPASVVLSGGPAVPKQAADVNS